MVTPNLTISTDLLWLGASFFGNICTLGNIDYKVRFDGLMRLMFLHRNIVSIYRERKSAKGNQLDRERLGETGA
jgi:hypothetical protein